MITYITPGCLNCWTGFSTTAWDLHIAVIPTGHEERDIPAGSGPIVGVLIRNNHFLTCKPYHT